MTSAILIQSAGSALHGARAALPAITAATGLAVSIATDHGHLLLERALAGNLDGDIVLLPDDMIDELETGGMLTADAPVRIGAVRIGAAVRQDNPAPDVSTMDALVRGVAGADEIVLTEAPTGAHMLQVLERLGLGKSIGEKLVRFDKAEQCNGYLLSSTRRSLGFGPATEIIAWKDRGLTYCGPVPEEIQVALPYSGAILRASEDANAAQAVLAYLGSERGLQFFSDSGVD